MVGHPVIAGGGGQPGHAPRLRIVGHDPYGDRQRLAMGCAVWQAFDAVAWSLVAAILVALFNPWQWRIHCPAVGDW